MGFAVTSFGCTVTVTMIFFATRDGENWSRSLAITWWTLLVASVLCSLIGLAAAGLRRGSAGRRFAIALLSLPALLVAAAVAFLVYELSKDTS